MKQDPKEVASQQKSEMEGNKIIAEFINRPFYQEAHESSWIIRPGKRNGAWIPFIDLKYHSSWDWLMPSWVKFVKLYHEFGKKGIYHERKLRSEFWDAADKGDIDKCHEIIVTGVKWYNLLK